MKIARIGSFPDSLRNHHDVHHFADAAALKRSGFAADALWLEAADEKEVVQALQTLRSDPLYAFVPIFVDEEIEGYGAFLHDGVVSDYESLLRRAKPMHRRGEGLRMEELRKTTALRLLTYLYLRPGSELLAYRHWDNEWIDTYPVAEALNDHEVETLDVLEILVRRKLVERNRLLDRLRLCPHCERPHHNFVDVCPEDGTIDIRKTDFIHCFTCGYVGPEEEFYRDGIFVCPNCKTQLRHIGSDYDRPLESYVCANGHKFVEPDVVAECLHCGATNDPEDLVVREVYAYALTPEGALAVRAGELSNLYAILDTTNYSHPDYFNAMLDWLLKLQRRDESERFSVLAIRFLNIAELVDVLGRAKVAEFMDEFASRMRELLRSTDVMTRTDETDIFILLPKTPRGGCETVLKRLEKLKRLIAFKERHIDFSLACVAVEAGGPRYEEAKYLLAELLAELSRERA
ncbi:TackOD1 domain-containing metal-binding protein [Hydrogenimonas sp.]